MPSLTFNPSMMLSGATRTAHDAGYKVEIISPEGGAGARATRILELADGHMVDGILSFSSVDIPDADLPADTAIVIAAEFDDEMRGIGQLADAAPIVEIIERLAMLGHRRFFHIAGPAQFASARARATAFRETVGRLGLESMGVYGGDWSGESGIAAVQSIRSGHEPTAIVAANDLVAMGALRAATQRGWDVPGDVSLTGWDDAPGSAFLTPSLTSVDLNLERIGGNAMARLIAKLRDEAPQPSEESVSRIVWRESTGPAPHG
ncbi:substrate-binding domain-containing protein [Microbacterium pumilum]